MMGTERSRALDAEFQYRCNFCRSTDDLRWANEDGAFKICGRCVKEKKKMDYKAAEDDLCASYGCNEGQALEKHWDTVIHALHTLQAITSALPEGVDPVKLVKGLAGEPSIDMQVEFAETWFSKSRCFDDPEFSDCWGAMRAQLYREASEVKG